MGIILYLLEADPFFGLIVLIAAVITTIALIVKDCLQRRADSSGAGALLPVYVAAAQTIKHRGEAYAHPITHNDDTDEMQSRRRRKRYNNEESK
jgi:hypothetical protein